MTLKASILSMNPLVQNSNLWLADLTRLNQLKDNPIQNGIDIRGDLRKAVPYDVKWLS